jgi:glycerol-3-phosphate dehydrogenase (NAD(P)+)
VRQILEQTLPVTCKLGTLSGPTFAVEIAKGIPSAIVAAAETEEVAERIQNIFSSSRLKVFTSTDPLGVEVGGALKNVIAIATGISDGLGLGYNTRAALITRGLVEITRIGTALGARPETFSGLSGVGDLVLTCTGDLSRNRAVGLQLGQGKTLNQITESMKMVAEGVLTVKSTYALKSKLNIHAAIIEETYQVLYEKKHPKQAMDDLMQVNISSEFSGIKGFK